MEKYTQSLPLIETVNIDPAPFLYLRQQQDLPIQTSEKKAETKEKEAAQIDKQTVSATEKQPKLAKI